MTEFKVISIVKNENRITVDRMSKFELTELESVILNAFADGKTFGLTEEEKRKNNITSEKMAVIYLLKNKRIPLKIRRDLGNGTVEEWAVRDLALP
jgi:hypothetical protein